MRHGGVTFGAPNVSNPWPAPAVFPYIGSVVLLKAPEGWKRPIYFS